MALTYRKCYEVQLPVWEIVGIGCAKLRYRCNTCIILVTAYHLLLLLSNYPVFLRRNGLLILLPLSCDSEFGCWMR